MQRIASLAGHTDSVLSCVIDPAANLLYSGGELPLDTDAAVPCIAPDTHMPHAVHAVAGHTAFLVDTRQTTSPLVHWKLPVATADLNCVAIQQPPGRHIALALDEGEVLVLQQPDLRGAPPPSDTPGPPSPSAPPRPAPRHVRRIRGAHDSIASAVAFRVGRPWEVVSGGLDCRVGLWDFSRGQCKHVWVCGGEEGGQMCNPPMVHSVCVPGVDAPGALQSRLIAVARGDGIVSVHDVQTQLASSSSSSSSRRPKSNTTSHNKNTTTPPRTQSPRAQSSLVGDVSSTPGEQHIEAHRAAANHVHFAAGCEGEVVVSGGNDGGVMLWRWQDNVQQRVEHGAKINCCAAMQRGQGGMLCCVGDVGQDVIVGVVR